jgi:asparagine synthase (glutamine-hydrolysing)
MCGILGCFSNKSIDKSFFRSISDMTIHRGPDFQNHFFENYNQNRKIAFGHNRLSIIDPTPESNQPFIDGEQVLVFNGEIYNYQILKDKLIRKNISFKTSGDTEVIIKLYQNFGIKKTLEMIEGMYAFCIYDKKFNKVFLARDKFGIKPLLYYVNKEDLFFSSELKSITNYYGSSLFNINQDAVASFYFHRYALEPDTIIKEIRMLEAGHYIEYDLDNHNLNDYIFWKPEIIDQEDNEQKIIDQLDQLLFEGIENHLVSDVPVSISFSGGLDSSLILAMAKKINPNIEAFSVNRGEKDIDTKYAVQIAEYLGVKLDLIGFENNLKTEEIDFLHKIYDQPIGCSSIFSTFILYKEIAKKGYKVTLIGDGGDELFGGYEWHHNFINSKLNFKNLLYHPKKVIKYNLLLQSRNPIERYKKIMLDRFDQKELIEDFGIETDISNHDLYQKTLLKFGQNELINIKDLMLLDFNSFLKYNLLRADFSSMAHSVEARVPFLNSPLVEYVFKIDPTLFNKGNQQKYLLKKVAERYLPKSLIYRPKKGFSSPVSKILPVRNGKEYQHYIFQKWKEKHIEK